MKCSDLFVEYSLCRRGMPVVSAFREYFCERNHTRCPLKRDASDEEGRAICRRKDLVKAKEES